jgi:hypothetical protein
MDVCFEPGVDYVATQPNCQAAGGGLDLAELAGQVAGRVGDSDDTQRGAVPKYSVIKLGDGDVEAVAELFLKRANDLAPILEGLRVLDGEFESEHGERHGGKGTEV